VAREGAATVTIVARNQKKLDDAAQLIEKENADTTVLAISADVTNADAMKDAVQQSESKHGGSIDYLLLVAGMAIPGYFIEQTPELARKLMDVNYFGVINTVYAALPGMAERQRGNIMIVASAISMLGFVGYTHYAGSKFALRGAYEAMRNEFIRHNVKVQIYYPSNMDTPGFEQENKTKPKETLEIEGTGALSTPEACAKICVGALASGAHTTCDETMTWLMRINTNGLAPRGNIFLEFLLFPLTFLIGLGFAIFMDMSVKPARETAAASADDSDDYKKLQ
jgi:short-subunit dehydrogenase